MITAKQLEMIMPKCPKDNLELFTEHLGYALESGNLTTVTRAAAFLGQLAHESGELRWWEEQADGSAYEGRKDLGNTEPGDGPKFKGHGPIQITGRANHDACGDALGLDLITNPRLLCEPVPGFQSAVWFWNSRGLSALADQLDFMKITKLINGGFNGLEQRVAYYRRALEVLGITASLG
jgi:putative chitinase